MSNTLELLLEKVESKIPEKMQKEIKSNKWRKEQMRKYGADVFLDPVDMKFPVKYNGKYDCRMIHAAVLHSAMFSKKGSAVNPASYYADIYKKAKKIYADNTCENEINIKLQEGDECELGLSDILEVYGVDAFVED